MGLLEVGQEEPGAARMAYQRAIDSGYAKRAPLAAFFLGLSDARQGTPAAARKTYQRAIDSGHADYAALAAPV